jgi:polyisoprenoid-binding protein YceI
VSQSATARTVEGIDLPPVGTWKLDQSHTMVEFVARHMLTKVRGRFTEFDGTIHIGEGPEDSWAEVQIEAASIQTNFEQRDGHLRSPDFLEAERFPRLTFKSKEVRPTGGASFQLIGDLTIKDITREVVLDAELLGFGPAMGDRTVMSFTARTEIDREDWDMTWNMVVETGGLLVSKRVQIELDVEAYLQQ